MPFTPFHMGPGIAIKAVLQGSFSLMVFGWAQIVMDIQPLLVMISGEGHLHGFSHTYLGATLLGLFSALSGKYLGEFGLWVLEIEKGQRIHIAWWVAVFSAFLGTYSHVLIDSMMHADMAPMAPLYTGNSLLGIISVEVLHKICLYSGAFGGALYCGVNWLFNKDAWRD